MIIEIKNTIGPNQSALFDPFDIIQLKRVLNQLGYYKPYERMGITEQADPELFKAIRVFQKENGLRVTGKVSPDDLTIQALNARLLQPPEGQYVWYATLDDKVRPQHQVLSGTVRDWSDSLASGREFNCRCWAEDVPYTVLRSINDIELMDHVKRFEEFIKYMYLDTTGNVTVGIGHRIANATEAKKLPFQIKDGKIWRNATEQEIADAYKKVAAKDYGQGTKSKSFDPNDKKRGLDNLRIDKKTATEKALAHLRRDVASLRRKFSDFDSFPVPAQKALIDMNYNLGNDGFSRSPANSNRDGWPKLFDAVENRDWALVATESRRSGLGEQSDSTSRNGAIFNLFNQAAAIEPKEIIVQDAPPRIE